MTHISEQAYRDILRRNPDLIAGGVQDAPRPEPERAKAYRMASRYVPTEAHEQGAVMEWAKWNEGQHPALRFLFHVPNEANRGDIGHIVAVRQGLKSGVPDLLLPVARGEYIGLAIEMKRADYSNYPTPEQWEWIEGMRGNGWRVEVCYGAGPAIAALQDYLQG